MVGEEREKRLTTVGSISLRQARRVLQAVVSTSESTITPTTPLDIVAGYTAEQIRKAATVVGMHIPKEQEGELTHIEEALKETPYGVAYLRMRKGLLRRGGVTDHYETVELSMLSGTWYTHIATFPLVEPSDDIERGLFSRYIQHDPPMFVNLANATSIDDFRKLFGSARWIFANMLSWKGKGFKMPWQLDNSSLPDPQITPQLPLPKQ